MSGGRRGDVWLLFASIGVGILGVVAVAVALLFGSGVVAPTAVEAAPRAPSALPEAPRAALEPGAEASDEPGLAVDPVWLADMSARTGIGERALAAYAETASRMAVEQPECGIGWNTLAGIGFVESEHGTIDGSVLADNGRAAPPIRGIALDGTRTMAIPDTDGGELDGDTVWDRAVGPMQFIPSTWAEWGSDGDGDGIVDPQDIDDAVYSAARYLCGIGGDLRDPGSWIAAVAAYNDTVEYNNRVAEAADHYARLAEG
ncbi:lytic transglycosylase domain-containing protein [Leucobacter sp.]